MTATWTTLAPQLEHLGPSQPREALALADAHRAELAPALVAVLDALVADPAPAKADGYVLHLYAMLLLAAWRDTRAYRPLAELGHLDEASIDEVFGQLVHDSYGRALASCCDGDIAPLTRLADDDSASLWSRAAALEALTLAALTALKCPQELKGHVRGALNNGCSVEEIRETLLHCAVYAGVPAAIDAFRAAQEIIDEYQQSN